jgi:hypothetical protein
MDEKISLLISSCDSYLDSVLIFNKLLRKNWNNIKMPIFLLNETSNVKLEGISTINGGADKNWSGRLIEGIKLINTEYILLMLDDYFIGSKVDELIFQDIIEKLEKFKMNYYRLTNIPKTKDKIKNIPFVGYIRDNQRYGINLQASIWRKEFLLNILVSDNYNAWQIESNLLEKVPLKFSNFHDHCYVDTRNVFNIKNGIIKGKWSTKTLKYFRNKDFVIDIGERKKMNFFDQTNILIRDTSSKILPRFMIRPIKNLLTKFKIKSATKN